jgi:uncharacterized protein with HEPN domain
MREPLRDRERLQHILSAIDRVQRYTDGKTYEELVGNDMMYYAVVKKIPANFILVRFVFKHS